jgi:hypothetical protein
MIRGLPFGLVLPGFLAVPAVADAQSFRVGPRVPVLSWVELSHQGSMWTSGVVFYF